MIPHHRYATLEQSGTITPYWVSRRARCSIGSGFGAHPSYRGSPGNGRGEGITGNGSGASDYDLNSNPDDNSGVKR